LSIAKKNKIKAYPRIIVRKLRLIIALKQLKEEISTIGLDLQCKLKISLN